MTIDTSTWPQQDFEFLAQEQNRTRWVAVCDPHLSAHSPPAYKTDYWALTKNSLESVFRFARSKQADGILWAGDIFHLKPAPRNPLWFMAEVIELFGNAGIPHYGIAGNHDIKFGHLEAGLQGQALDLLIKAGVYHLLDRQELLCIAGDHTTRIAGGSYRHAQAEHVRAKTKKGASHLITLGHFWFGPESGEFFGEPIYGPDYLQSGETDLYVIGHHHEDQGLQEVAGKQYLSPGSLSRTGAHKHDLERKPAAAYIETSKEKIEVKILRPKVPAPEDCMDLEKRAQIMEEKKEMEQFITMLTTAQINGADPRKVLDELNPPAKVKQRALDYIANAETANA